MTDAQTALSRRLVACKGWRWLQGCTARGQGVHEEGAECLYVCGHNDDTNVSFFLANPIPDLTDLATLGCLLALVREAYRDPYLCAVGDPDTGWRIDAVTAQVQDLHGYASEAEALVFALEGAP